MPNRVTWEPDFGVGHALIDDQHRGLLAQCNRLADLCPADDGDEQAQTFDRACEQLKALVREHFAAEVALLAHSGWPHLEDHAAEADEFEYLVGEVATVEHFDRPELQRFLAVWCIGHIKGAAEELRGFLAGRNAPV